MNKLMIAALCTISMSCLAPALYADTSPSSSGSDSTAAQPAAQPYKDATDKLKKMSKEDRKKLFEDTKAKWDKLSPEDKKAFQEKVQDQVSAMRTQIEKQCELLREKHGEEITLRLYMLDQLQGNDKK